MLSNAKKNVTGIELASIIYSIVYNNDFDITVDNIKLLKFFFVVHDMSLFL